MAAAFTVLMVLQITMVYALNAQAKIVVLVIQAH
jgi:hypothetical protein